MPSFLASGKLGDIIYALPTINALGGGTLYLTNRPPHAPVTPAMFEAIAPLLRAQSHIKSVSMHNGEKVDRKYDLTDFRSAYDGKKNLAEVQAIHLSPTHYIDMSLPWLELNRSEDPHDRPVFARSMSYRAPDWQFIWPEIMEENPGAVFIGTPEEHRDFTAKFGEIEYHNAANLLKAAQTIIDGSIFIGNQSAPYAIAEGLKHPSIQETCPSQPDCIFPRANARFISNLSQWEKDKRGKEMKFMLALQCFEEDAAQALELTRLLVEIEPEMRPDIEFALIHTRKVPRSTASAILDAARARFPNVVAIQSRRFGTGWPMGCNDLWQDGMAQIEENSRIKAEAIFTFEPDCVPMRPDWINVLKAEWRRAKARGKECVGHIHYEPRPHINGNAVFARGILNRHKELYGCSATTGWDVEHGPLLLKLGEDTAAITQVYKTRDQVTAEWLKDQRKDGIVPAIVHGIKNNSGIKAVRSMMATDTFGEQPVDLAPIDKSGSVLISILCLNRLEFTNRCIESVLANTGGEFKIIVHDNGSDDGTGEYLREMAYKRPDEKITVTSSQENTGFIAPNNRAFKIAVRGEFRYFIALNNDTIVPPGWIEKLREPLDRLPKAALSGPMGTCATLNPDFHGFNGKDYEYVEGSCLCAKVEIVKQYGNLFSDYLDFIYGDDSDLSLRMREKGYSIHRVNFQLEHSRGETVMKQPEVKARCQQAQARNHTVLKKRWAHYLKVRRFDYPIIVKRTFAIGDVLLTTPIIRAIKEACPLSPIQVETKFPEVMRGNPNVKGCGVFTYDNGGGIAYSPFEDGILVDLDMAYENRPGMHILKAYEEVAREAIPGLGEIIPKTELFPSIGDDISGVMMANSAQLADGKKLCVIHCDKTDWPGKNYPSEKILIVASAMERMGFTIAWVGGKKYFDAPQGAIDLRGKTTITQLASVMRIAALFIGIDSFPMHCAQAMGCPTIGLFGVSSPECIMTEGSPHIGLVGDKSIPCCGQRHREKGTTFVNCDPACIESITVGQIIEAVEMLTKTPSSDIRRVP